VAANQTGWIAAEVGRQPWIVQPPIVRDAGGEPALDAEGFVRHGTVDVPMPDGSVRTLTAGLRTSKAVSEVVTSNHVLASMAMFGVIYTLLLVLWIYILNGKIQKGPEPAGAHLVEPHGLRDAASALAGHHASLTRPEEA
jgi:cytochrome d ubiquinol oxidase subunit I